VDRRGLEARQSLKPVLGPKHEQKVDRSRRADQRRFDREYMTT